MKQNEKKRKSMCLYPKLIKNPKYKANKKNGGVIPAVFDERLLYVPIGCQNCIECRGKKAREWQVRLNEEIKSARNGHFITLTFSDESIKDLAKDCKATGYELDNEIATKAVRLWLERWRKKHKKSIRHWLITELGHNGTENIHLHGIIWTDHDLKEVEQTWKYGFMWKGKETNGKYENYVNEKTINYIVKYVNKVDEKHTKYKSIILTSAGIGHNYTKQQQGDHIKNKYKGKETIETYRTPTGQKIALPIYYRNKIYTEEEREKLWLDKLDKEERWVLGTKIDISETITNYDKILKSAQEKNKRLGYGDGTKDWKKEEYEKARRLLMQQTRIEKANQKTLTNDTKTKDNP